MTVALPILDFLILAFVAFAIGVSTVCFVWLSENEKEAK